MKHLVIFALWAFVAAIWVYEQSLYEKLLYTGLLLITVAWIRNEVRR